MVVQLLNKGEEMKFTKKVCKFLWYSLKSKLQKEWEEAITNIIKGAGQNFEKEEPLKPDTDSWYRIRFEKKS